MHVLRDVIRRLNRGYMALPPATRRGWWRRIALGALAVLVLMAVLVQAARALERSGQLAWELEVVRWMDRSAPVSFSTAMWLEGVGNGFVLWAVVLYAAAMSARAGRPLQTLAFLVGHTMVYLPIAFGWWMWERPRPQVVLEGLASPGGVFHAFPSGHMVQSAFAFGLLLWLWLRSAAGGVERAVVLLCYLLLIVVIGFGRLRIGVHWPTDVVAGGLIGGLWAVMVARATALGETHWDGLSGGNGRGASSAIHGCDVCWPGGGRVRRHEQRSAAARGPGRAHG